MSMMVETYSENRGDFHLKIESKKLISGKCQVKFYAQRGGFNNLYGYVLVEPSRTLKEVVIELKDKLESISDCGSFYQSNLFSIRKSSQNFDGNFMIFRN